MKQVRRKVVSGYASGGGYINNNYYRVVLSCGHKGTAQGRTKANGTRGVPETSVCYECSKLATEKENAK